MKQLKDFAIESHGGLDRNLARAPVVDSDKFTATEAQHLPNLG